MINNKGFRALTANLAQRRRKKMGEGEGLKFAKSLRSSKTSLGNKRFSDEMQGEIVFVRDFESNSFILLSQLFLI